MVSVYDGVLKDIPIKVYRVIDNEGRTKFQGMHLVNGKETKATSDANNIKYAISLLKVHLFPNEEVEEIPPFLE